MEQFDEFFKLKNLGLTGINPTFLYMLGERATSTLLYVYFSKEINCCSFSTL